MCSKLGRFGPQNCAGYIPCLKPAEICFHCDISFIESSAISTFFDSELTMFSDCVVSATSALAIRLVACSGG